MPNLLLDLRFLGYAIKVVEHRSFRRAAVALGLSQSTISRRIQILEDRLGVILFRRHRYGVELTEQGARFLAAAQINAERLQRAAREVRLGRERTQCELRLGVADFVARNVLRRVLKEFRIRHPDVVVEVEETNRETLLHHVHDGILDIAFVTGQPPPRGMMSLELWQVSTVIALPRNHSLATGSHVDWCDLVNENFIIGDCDAARVIEDFLVRRFAELGCHPRIQTHRVSHLSLLDLVSLGVGLTLTARTIVPRELTQDIVLRILLEGGPSIASVAVWHPNNLSAALKNMVAVLNSASGRRQYSRPAAQT